MKLGLIGDIHGNHIALKAVLTAARACGVERLLVTGDLVGYYFWPKEVLELLAPWDKVVVRGNHEEMLRMALADASLLPAMEQRHGGGIRVALETLAQEQIDWLASLPISRKIRVGECRVLLCHGAPWDPNHYVYPDAGREVIERCCDDESDVIVLGHTHYPMHRKCGRTAIVNPGSTGQPRNRQPGAHWAILDTATGSVEHRVEGYDAAPILAQCRDRHPDLPYLRDVLVRT